MVRAFVKASLKGFLYGRQNPDEAVAIVQKFSQAVVPAIARREFEMSWDTWVTPNTAGKPIGWMSDADWDETVKVLQEYGGVSTPLKAADLFTNEFVPAGSEFDSSSTEIASGRMTGRGEARGLLPMRRTASVVEDVTGEPAEIAANPPEPPYLEFRNLAKVYATNDGPVRALDRVS